MITGIDVIFIHAKNSSKLSNWYKEVLELEIGFQTPDFSWQEFKFSEERSTTRFAIDYGGENPSEVEKQKVIISFKVEDIIFVVEHLEKKGIVFFGKEKINDVGPTLVATFQDPEGNWIQVSQRKILK